MTIPRLILFVFYFLLAANSRAQMAVTVNEDDPPGVIGKHLSYLIDDESGLTPEAAFNSDDFRAIDDLVPNLGQTAFPVWIRFSVKNNTSSNILFLQLEKGTLDNVIFYAQDSTGIDSMFMGEQYPFHTRKHKSHQLIFDLNISPGSTARYLLKISSSEQIQLPLRIGLPESINQYNRFWSILFGLYCGVIIVMLLYNLFIYTTVRDITYLYYVIYILVVGLTQATIEGYAYQFFWPNWPWMAKQSFYIFTALVNITGIEFTKAFLHTKTKLPRWHRVSYVLNGLYVVYIILSISGLQELTYKLLQGTASVVSLYLLAIALILTKQNYRPAKFFLIAWSLLLVGIIIYVLKDFGILPYTPLTNYTMQIGTALEVVLLSFALADKINILEKEKEESQRRELEALSEKEKLVREQNIMLEQKVSERTSELQQSNENLNEAMNKLKETQSQLVSAEKMASLGQLTAGIAHEINNPINFIASNVKPLKQDIDDVIQLIDFYSTIKDTDDVKLKVAEAHKLKEELDIDYSIEEIGSLLAAIDEGALRTAEIVKGLRNFSRLDETDLKAANINDGIESTLTLLKNNFNGIITVQKELGDLPEIECYPGKLNQVFMNLLTNAAQAIEEKDPPPPEKIIKIKTWQDDDFVYISIKDNGIGMSEAVKQKIFEPFYTTKDVGKGTGLGLSIVFTIINNHNGLIDVNSEEGKGTEFILALSKHLEHSQD